MSSTDCVSISARGSIVSEVAFAGLLQSARRGSDTLFSAMSVTVVAMRIDADATTRLPSFCTSTDSIVAVVNAHSRANAKTYSLGSTGSDR